MPATQMPEVPGFFANLKQKLNVNMWMEKLNLTRHKLIEIGLYLGIGLLSGFLIKKYSKYIFVVFVCLVALTLLQQFNIVAVIINWDRVQELFGLQPIAQMTGQGLLSLYLSWIKANLMVAITFSVGFVFGLKLA